MAIYNKVWVTTLYDKTLCFPLQGGTEFFCDKQQGEDISGKGKEYKSHCKYPIPHAFVFLLPPSGVRYILKPVFFYLGFRFATP
ncbi:hypothetical protein EVA_03823 [gut metagenome]|uniref:Uncharacterized protein n=1 Tax=gut metagenome TaxID=749906 RepID=J9H391_9ZZZZ